MMPDSYAGVFPDGAIGPLFYDYNFCSSGFLSAELTAKCQDRQLTNMDVVKEYLGQSPAVPVAFLQVSRVSPQQQSSACGVFMTSQLCAQSKTDSVQMSFYVSLGLTTPNTTAAITPAQFYQDVNDIFGVTYCEWSCLCLRPIPSGLHQFDLFYSHYITRCTTSTRTS